MAGTQLLRKLTIATAIGSKSAILEIAQQGRPSKDAPEGSFVPMLRVIGRVFKAKPGSVSRVMPNGETMESEFLKLTGEFSATNLETGEVFPNVATCILPNFVADTIGSALADGAESVDFAIELTVRFKEKAATMYEFGCNSLIPIAKASSVSDIEAKLASLGIEATAPRKLLAAPAPAPEAAPTPAPKTKAKK